MDSDLDTSSSLGSAEPFIHYGSFNGADHPSIPYPPPTYIDFASGDLRLPFSPTRPSALPFHCQWLGGPHDGYPLATTLDEYMRLRQAESAPSTLEYGALIQCQLTFGFLEAVLRIKVPESFLLAQAADGTPMLSLNRLPVLARDWFHRCRVGHEPDKCQPWLKDVKAALLDAGRLVDIITTPSTNPFPVAGIRREAFANMILAVCTIGLTLQMTLSSVPSLCFPDRVFKDVIFSHRSPVGLALAQLRNDGWCPVTIAALAANGSVMPEYARSFRPVLRDTEEHSQCTDTACTVNNIDPLMYIQRHSPDTCDCAPTIPPFHVVASLLSAGRIPVVTLSDGRLSVRAAEDVLYVAISHVWIDGLGSTTEEGLPACQIARIASMASSLVPGGAFWIDGLCVPKQNELRTRAIHLMAKTYTDAAAVLVIDASIRSCSKDAPLEEKLLRIFTSGWMQRLWTYQEAMLAKRLWFEFADALVNIEDLVASPEECASSPLLLSLTLKLSDMCDYISGGGSAKDSLTIGEVAYGIKWRTTSKSEDETLAIAGLLQLDIRELLKAPSPDERMKSLLLQKGRIYPTIIFTTAPKILGIPGFSWAPRSFMTGPYTESWVRGEAAICTPTGLLAEYASLILSEPVKPNEDTRRVIRHTIRPGCNFLMRRLHVVPGEKRELCNAILIERDIPTIAGSRRSGVGVSMVGMEEGMLGEEVHVCLYRDISFEVCVIDDSEASRLQASGTPVTDAKWCPRMKVKLV